MLWLAYAILKRLLGLFAADGPSLKSLELENAVLRHQLKVLCRTQRPRLSRWDRVLLAACSRHLPRKRWGSFIVTPQTLLRWHRDLVRGRWTHARRREGRPPIDPEVKGLILRLGRENPAGAARASRASFASWG